MKRTYLAIDLKSFYASVECVERGLDPLTTNLVVADQSRTEKTICLAVSPSLKAYGISGRARLFEVNQRVSEINRQRLNKAVKSGSASRALSGKYEFASESFDDPVLKNDPSVRLAFIIATPRMRLYEDYSTRIYSVYLKYIAPEDIHVYSIDEVFIDVTRYLKTYRLSAHSLAMKIIRDVLDTTGITATVGIGTNLYLAKVAMDIVAKHIPADKDGVRISEIDEIKYRELLWCHRPLTDFWRVGSGYAKKLAAMGLYTMGDIARASLDPKQEAMLYRAFGVNTELLIDHAWGWEPTTIELIKQYRPCTSSISTGQVLKEPYTCEKGRLIVREMTELMVQELFRRRVVTKQLVLNINYDRESLNADKPGKSISDTVYVVAKTGKRYNGKVTLDYYGRPSPAHTHGTGNLPKYTNSERKILAVVTELYDRIVDPDLYVRRINIAACCLLPEASVPEDAPEQLDFFTDYDRAEKERIDEEIKDEKERNLMKATLSLQNKFGKNAVLKGMNFIEGGTTIERNGQIGGHRA